MEVREPQHKKIPNVSPDTSAKPPQWQFASTLQLILSMVANTDLSETQHVLYICIKVLLMTVGVRNVDLDEESRLYKIL